MLQKSSERYDIILDTEVLKLFLIGLYDTKSITRRCKDFNETDFNTLLSFLAAKGKKIIITPHLLAEVSNVLEKPRDNFENVMENALEHMQKMREIPISKKNLIKDNKDCLCKFGFADASMFNILEKARKHTLVITTDKPFLYYCSNKTIDVRQFPFFET